LIEHFANLVAAPAMRKLERSMQEISSAVSSCAATRPGRDRRATTAIKRLRGTGHFIEAPSNRCAADLAGGR
jgi:hypothetical protein